MFWESLTRFNVTSWLQRWGQAFSDICYPPFCLHCDASLKESSELLCTECQVELELIDPQERCIYCFSADISSRKRVCPSCLQRAPLLHRVGAVFDEQGAAKTVLDSLKGGMDYLASGAAGYMALQWGQLGWPIPDVVVPIPGSFSRWLQKGYNPRVLLAQEVGKLLNRPVRAHLRRTSLQMEAPVFKFRGSPALAEQTVLLIDDVWVSGATLRAASEALAEGMPGRIYGLTLCRALW